MLKSADVVGKGAFERRETISVDINLTKTEQPYVIIPCTFYPRQEGKFSLSVAPHGDCPPSELKMKQCPQTWERYSVRGQWKGPTAGGCRNHPKTWLHNPQFCLKIATKSDVVIILAQTKVENSLGFYVVKTDGTIVYLFFFHSAKTALSGERANFSIERATHPQINL